MIPNTISDTYIPSNSVRDRTSSSNRPPVQLVNDPLMLCHSIRGPTFYMVHNVLVHSPDTLVYDPRYRFDSGFPIRHNIGLLILLY